MLLRHCFNGVKVIPAMTVATVINKYDNGAGVNRYKQKLYAQKKPGRMPGVCAKGGKDYFLRFLISKKKAINAITIAVPPVAAVAGVGKISLNLL